MSMFMGGGGGAWWCIDAQRRLAAISFTQTFGGRSVVDGSDGHGPRANDAMPFARASADKADTLLVHNYGEYGEPGCTRGRARVRLPLGAGGRSRGGGTVL